MADELQPVLHVIGLPKRRIVGGASTRSDQKRKKKVAQDLICLCSCKLLHAKEARMPNGSLTVCVCPTQMQTHEQPWTLAWKLKITRDLTRSDVWFSLLDKFQYGKCS